MYYQLQLANSSVTLRRPSTFTRSRSSPSLKEVPYPNPKGGQQFRHASGRCTLIPLHKWSQKIETFFSRIVYGLSKNKTIFNVLPFRASLLGHHCPDQNRESFPGTPGFAGSQRRGIAR